MNEENKSWWQRNWKWALPTGGCLTIIICIVAFIGYGVYKVTDAISENSSILTFISVVTEVQKDEEVIEALGKPIRMDDFDDGQYDPELDKDHLEIEMELDGSKADGILRVNADRIDGKWIYREFSVTVEGTNQVIDLKDNMED